MSARRASPAPAVRPGQLNRPGRDADPVRPGATAVLLAALLATGCAGGWTARGPADDVRTVPIGAEGVRRLSYPPLRFDMPEPERFELSNGVTVFFLRDETLPLADVFILLEGGYASFDREYFAPGSALLSLMRHGGTAELTPDSLDAVLEFHALGTHTYSDGARVVLGVRGLRRHLDLALSLWSDILLRPRFEPAAIERWRLREIDAVRHAGDFPGSLAVLEFNRLLYGDHPTGWMLTEADLTPERLAVDRLRWVHRRVVCPERAVIGASGDVTREELEAALEAMLGDWRPCDAPAPEPPVPVLRPDPGTYVIPRTLPQSTIVVGQPGGVLLEETEDYFASRVANWVIGGSGPTSRLDARIRGQEGLAYSAASIWGVASEHERIFGAISHTRASSTIEALQAILGTLNDALTDPPRPEEIDLARESIRNGFVFGFGSASQIVGRQVSYMADGLPADWMSRYLEGIRRVDDRQVARVLRRHIRPGDYTILIVGDTTAFDLAALGRYTVLPGR
jgi:zinc protease